MQNGGVPAHRVPIERVHRIFDECKRRGVTSVAIMLTNDPDEMIELAREVRPDILHIAGDGYAADEAFAARLKEAAPNTKLMQAVLVDDESAVDRAKKYAQYCDLILTDSGLAPDTGIGASGLTHDWSIAPVLWPNAASRSSWLAALDQTMLPKPSNSASRMAWTP